MSSATSSDVWGFTTGSAVRRQKLVAGDHREQISAVLRTFDESSATSAV